MLTTGITLVILVYMKTAVSIPDPIYSSAEKLANRLGKTRSELYAQALSSYVAKHKNDGVIEKLNKVYSSEKAGVDPLLSGMQSHTIFKEKW